MRTKLSEHDIQKEIVQYLRLNRWVVICTDVMVALAYITNNKRFAFIRHYKNVGYTKGQPDLVAVKDGKTMFLEVKTKKGRQTPEQQEIMERMHENGAEMHVVRSVDEVMMLINNFKA